MDEYVRCGNSQVRPDTKLHPKLTPAYFGQARLVELGMQLRALALLLKSRISVKAADSQGFSKVWYCPRAVYFQVNAALQYRCGIIERQLLGALQDSMFDPKRYMAEALPNFYVFIALLSTYSILGTCPGVGEPADHCTPKLSKC
jgi:hypothetical protein